MADRRFTLPPMPSRSDHALLSRRQQLYQVSRRQQLDHTRDARAHASVCAAPDNTIMTDAMLFSPFGATARLYCAFDVRKKEQENAHGQSA
jgi:hypothetical protein